MSSAELDPEVPEAKLVVAAIDAALYGLSRQYGRVILLLDRFGQDPLAAAIAALKGPVAASLPLDDKIFKDDLTQAPLLVELLHAIPTHNTLLQLSIETAQRQSERISGSHAVCAWLFSNAPLKRIRSELRQRLDARYPRHRIYFRYFDPRVMPRLANILVPKESVPSPRNSSFADLLGPVEVWCHLDRQGQFARHDNPAPQNANYIGHLRFDETTASTIDRIEGVNLTVRQLSRRSRMCVQSEDVEIDAYIVEAMRRGVRNKDDQVAYAWRAVAYGQEFTQHLNLQEWIEEAAATCFPLDYFLADKLPTNE